MEPRKFTLSKNSIHQTKSTSHFQTEYGIREKEWMEFGVKCGSVLEGVQCSFFFVT
jgi:hypothetical protein